MKATQGALALAFAFFATSGVAKARSYGDQSYGYLNGTPPADWDGFKLRDGYKKLRRAGVPTPSVHASERGGLNIYFDLPANSARFDPTGRGPVYPSTLAGATKVLESLAGTKVQGDPWRLGLVKNATGALAADKGFEFWVDPNGKVTVRIDPSTKLEKGDASVDAGLRSAGEFYDSVARILKARALPVPEQLHTQVVDALEQALGKELTTAQRYKADGLFVAGKSGIEILRGMGVKMSDAVVKRVEAFDEQVERYPGIRDPQYRSSQHMDWSAILDSAAELSKSRVKAPADAGLAVPGPSFGESDAIRGTRVARTTGMSRLLEERVEGAAKKTEHSVEER